ncbi:putative flavin-containing polyamine oxidase [Delitschia confertaspora ATCC 74209]|uniref:Amine oxidase n=1 Tax=Delitschia confertaspora ATCC 74209 TaxID=1513339 RepID=A0A9P4JF94_9PLEO|nr:putative flavin-containing polyamine oxidase [Delitschia confertaspora ATCC 74209]
MLRRYLLHLLALCGTLSASSASTTFTARDSNYSNCRKTSVVILGGGVAGITAAQALANQSITDFLIVEYNGEIGGRMKHTNFGKNPNGKPYVVELGANWVQGLGTDGGPENPIWTFVKKYNVSNTYSNYSSIQTYDETGYTDYSSLLDDYEEAYAKLEQNAGVILTNNLQDMSTRAGESLAGWKPKKDMKAQAVEWWEWDWETSYPPEQSSLVFGITGYNLTFYQFSDENNFVTDQRGFNTWLKGVGSTFLKPNDKRLLLNTIVTDISYSKNGVTVTNSDGSCISAAYAICTFSLGVLQNDAVTFKPELPSWKQTAIHTFQMGTYTKIFMQFNETFWDPNTQFFLYASPTTRGYYPVFQSLSTPDFLPNSNILFVTVVEEESYRIESQSDSQTQSEVLAVLRQMFPNTTIPEPTAFMYPRWSLEPWVYGSYSNWPVGTTLENHQNLRANVGRVHFAGEHTSAEYFGFLQGAWFEGQEVGERVAGMLGRECRSKETGCGEYRRYEVLHGTTRLEEYNAVNGWRVSSFYDIGFE